jgi:hypothetical protein
MLGWPFTQRGHGPSALGHGARQITVNVLRPAIGRQSGLNRRRGKGAAVTLALPQS